MKGAILVIGLPMPQGSKTAFSVKKKGTPGNKPSDFRAVVTEGRNANSRERFKSWREAVSAEARTWVRVHGNPAPIEGAVRIKIDFALPRPKSLPKRVVHHTKKPDADKLTRAVFDALTGIIYRDDSQIFDFHPTKRYAIDSPPGAYIEWEAA